MSGAGDVTLEVGGLARDRHASEEEADLLVIHGRYILRNVWSLGSRSHLAYALLDVVAGFNRHVDSLNSPNVGDDTDPRSYQRLQLPRCDAVTLRRQGDGFSRREVNTAVLKVVAEGGDVSFGLSV